jgi:hypothetical protein
MVPGNPSAYFCLFFRRIWGRLFVATVESGVGILQAGIGDMGIYLSSGDIGMAQHFLDAAQVGTIN